MSRVAKVFTIGRSQAVRLPADFRFEGTEVYVRCDPETGDVILSRKPGSRDDFLAALAAEPVPGDFLDAQERAQGPQDRDPFAG